MSSGPRSKPVSDRGFGRPAFGIARDRHVRFFRELLQKRIHQIGTERAVEPHRQRFHVPHRVPERLSRLRRDHRLAATPHRRRDHYWQFLAVLIEDLADGDQCRLGVQRIEDRLDQEQVYAAGDESAHLLCVSGFDLIESDHPKAWIVGIGRVRERTVSGPIAPATKR